MDQDQNNKNNGVYSKRIRAGRRRTYFFDVRTTKSNDYYLTITESKKRHDDDGYERHKLFLYKEDFNKFMTALQETVEHIKKEYLPEYDFDEYSRRDEGYEVSDEDDFKGDRRDSRPQQPARESKEDEQPVKPRHDDDTQPERSADDDLRWG